MKVEVVTYNLESVIIAELCGASRVELCANESAGGTSPGIALLEAVKEQCNIPVYVMVRPREGDFTYNINEVKQILKEINLFKKYGADGIVCAALKENGEVDTRLLKIFVDASFPLPFTFHRAFDYVVDPFATLDKIISCGCHRILSSGLQPTAQQGIPLLKELILRSGEDIIIMPGAGINATNVNSIINETGCEEIHLSAKKIIKRKSILNPKIILGIADENNTYQCTDQELLMTVLQKVKQ